MANANYNSTGDPVSNGIEGKRMYELNNHLGNVMATISDRKIGVDNNGSIAYYKAEVLSSQDYYAFGMLMPGRTYTNAGAKYKYGFNGKENDNEVKGEGNQQDYGMRIYDPRLGRFLSIDPLKKEYPWYTPFQFAGNKPVWAVDLDGLEEISFTELLKRSVSGKPSIQLASEWTPGDRGRINEFSGTNTFYNASIHNTLHGNARLYTNIEQRNAYYQFAQRYIDQNSSTASQSYWFSAASIVTKWNAVGAAERVNLWWLNDGADDFLTKGNTFLFPHNMDNLKGIMNSSLDKTFTDANGKNVSLKGLQGKELDYALVLAP